MRGNVPKKQYVSFAVHVRRVYLFSTYYWQIIIPELCKYYILLDEHLLILKELRGNSYPGSAAPKQKKVSKKDRLDLSLGISVSIAELQPAQNAGSQSPVSSRQPKTRKKMQSKGKAKGKRKKKVKNTLLNTSPSSSKDDLQLMDYVIVEYEGSRFPGQINGIDFKDDKKVYKVSCMVKYLRVVRDGFGQKPLTFPMRARTFRC